MDGDVAASIPCDRTTNDGAIQRIFLFIHFAFGATGFAFVGYRTFHSIFLRLFIPFLSFSRAVPFLLYFFKHTLQFNVLKIQDMVM